MKNNAHHRRNRLDSSLGNTNVYTWWLPLLCAGLLTVIGCSDDGGSPGDDDGRSDVQTDVADAGGLDTSPDADPDATPDPDAPVEPDAPDSGMDESDGGDTETDPDTGPPDLAITKVTPERGPVSGGTKFVLSGDGFTPETEVYFGSRRADVDLTEGQLIGRTPEAVGPGKVGVKALDPQTGSDSITEGFEYIPTLSVDSISPTKIPVEGGPQVLLEGTGFDSTARVSFGGATGESHNVVDSQSMSTVAPPHAAGKVDVRVTTQSESLVLDDAVTYVETVELDGLSPTIGSTSGGQSVTLTGEGFESGMSVFIGGQAATVDSVSSSSQATVTTPPGTGVADVSVQVSGVGADILTDAYVYSDTPNTLDLVSVRPDHGSTAGGTEVSLTGSGLSDSGLTVEFGGVSATIVSQSQGQAVVQAPAQSAGLVDVSVSDSSGASATLADAFDYQQPLSIDSVTPGEAQVGSSTTVTIDGSGFTGASSVRFGVVESSFTVQNDSTIEATLPDRAPGTVDVVVERGDMEGRLKDGFTITEPLDVFGLSPARGSVAGNTYVEIRGRGFVSGDLSVSFGPNDGSDIEVLDSQTLAVRSPSHPPGTVDVSVTRGGSGGMTVPSPDQYTYFNPGARNGGAWGGPIQGAVNVSVYSRGGGPLQYAHVQLSTNADTAYSGLTDQNGLITLSGPDVYGQQTITATAKGYSSTTVQTVDAENITIFLTSSASGSPPPGPPTATFTGQLEGLDKLGEPGDNEEHRAIVLPTKRSPSSQRVPPGSNNLLTADGQYEVNTRVGDLALVAVGGVFEPGTGTFKPERMGVERYLVASGGQTYTRDIDLNIKLDQSQTFKINDVPNFPGGADTRRVVSYLDFGFEGVFGDIYNVRGSSNILTVDDLPKFSGALSDLSMVAVGGVYTEAATSDSLGSPQAVSQKSGIGYQSAPVQMPPLLGIADITVPLAGGTPPSGLVEFNYASPNNPDLFWVRVRTLMDAPVWDGFIPGSARSLQLPDFPSFSDLPEEIRPAPYPAGSTLRLSIVGIRAPGVTYNSFSYSDLSRGQWEAFSISGQAIQF